jgi:hypothetical protein
MQFQFPFQLASCSGVEACEVRDASAGENILSSTSMCTSVRCIIYFYSFSEWTNRAIEHYERNSSLVCSLAVLLCPRLRSLERRKLCSHLRKDLCGANGWRKVPWRDHKLRPHELTELVARQCLQLKCTFSQSGSLLVSIFRNLRCHVIPNFRVQTCYEHEAIIVISHSCPCSISVSDVQRLTFDLVTQQSSSHPLPAPPVDSSESYPCHHSTA